MFNIGDTVTCREINPIFPLVGSEVGTVTSAYFARNDSFISVQYITVLFPIYGAEQGAINSSFYILVNSIPGPIVIVPDTSTVNEEASMLQAKNIVRSQIIYMSQLLADNPI